MNNAIRVLGAGLICVDIVRNEASTKIMNGGSCANVISVLSQIGYDCSVIREKYDDPLESFLSTTLSTLGVKEVYYKQSRTSAPRIIEDLSGAEHSFFTVCPCCGKKILSLKLPTSSDIKSVSDIIETTDVLYCDRTSSGLRELMEIIHTHNGVVFYEPNSARNLKGLLETAAISDVIKFSKDRIPMSVADTIRNDNSQVKLIISTLGAQGLAFSHRTLKGEMSPWITLPSIFNEPVIDSSGAGDWLTAGFLSELLKDRNALSLETLYNGEEIANMLNSGMKYSKLCCAAIGAQGFFYAPEYSREFNKLSSRNNRVESLRLVNDYVDNKQLCPMCFSLLPSKDLSIVS